LPHDRLVAVAKSGDWVVIRIGPWTFCLAVNKDGRFPDLSRHIPRPADATARCRLSPADAEFLGQTLPRLPCDETYNFPITLDLNGSIAIRAKAADQPRPTEVVLAGSEWSGEPVQLNMNRKFLARALKLGFSELLIYGDKLPVVCHDEHRHFVWATLDADTAIPPANDAIRIESPSAGTEIPVSKPKPQRRTIPVPDTTTNNGHAQANGQAKTNGQARKSSSSKASQQDLAGLIAQVETLRQSQRETLLKTNELLKGLKRHRRQSRALESTIASLRQLKTLGV
jgi:hypothetical protein